MAKWRSMITAVMSASVGFCVSLSLSDQLRPKPTPKPSLELVAVEHLAMLALDLGEPLVPEGGGRGYERGDLAHCR